MHTTTTTDTDRQTYSDDPSLLSRSLRSISNLKFVPSSPYTVAGRRRRRALETANPTSFILTKTLFVADFRFLLATNLPSTKISNVDVSSSPPLPPPPPLSLVSAGKIALSNNTSGNAALIRFATVK
mmetsp:Transcript_26586/g.74364  ORF Transcript_26586/g.74364 Transcript_26586/m.74364 type:complete len:127 (-) Transcript_26586:382-762(-)